MSRSWFLGSCDPWIVGPHKIVSYSPTAGDYMSSMGSKWITTLSKPSQRFFGSFHSMGAPASVRQTQLQPVVSMRLALDIWYVIEYASTYVCVSMGAAQVHVLTKTWLWHTHIMYRACAISQQKQTRSVFVGVCFIRMRSCLFQRHTHTPLKH